MSFGQRRWRFTAPGLGPDPERVAHERQADDFDGSSSFPSIVCGVDETADGRAARAVAAELGEYLGLALLDPAAVDGRGGALAAEFEALLETQMRGALKLLQRTLYDVAHDESEVRVRGGDVAQQLAQVATEESADLIVVASRGRGRVRAELLGSTSAPLAADPPVPVVILPPHVVPTIDRGTRRRGER